MFNFVKISFIDDLFLYSASLIFGIVSYFYYSFLLFIPILFLIFFSRQWNKVISCILIFLFGVFIIHNRMGAISKYFVLSEPVSAAILDSEIVQIHVHDNEYSLVLHDVKIKKSDEFVILDKVRLKVNNKYHQDLYAGYRVSFPRVDLAQPSDLSYQDFSAMGYTDFEPEVIDSSSIFFFYKIYNYLDHLLDKVSAPDDVKQITKVFLLGKSFKMENSLYEYFQKSGLSHILVISGLHIIILGLMTLNIVRTLMCLNTNLALYHPVKKYACVVTIFILTIYLFLTGLSSSTERAYIVICLNLIAIMLDKIAFGMHSLNLAVFVILFFSPEQIFLPGFQLTFISVMAIFNVIYYYNQNESNNVCKDCQNSSDSFYSQTDGEYYCADCQESDELHEDPYDIGISLKSVKKDVEFVEGTWVQYLQKYLFIVLIMSVVITLVTNIVGMYYFRMISTYVFIINIVVIPVVVFLVMPCIILLMILGLFGLQQLPFFILTPVISLIISLAKFCSNLDYIFIPINNLNPFFWSIGLVSIVFVLAIKEIWWKLFLTLFAITSIIIALIILPANPDIYVFGKNILIRNSDSFYLVSGRYNDFLVKKIGGNVGYDHCRSKVCKYQIDNKSVTIVKGKKDLDCISSNTDFILQGNTLHNCLDSSSRILSNSINKIFLSNE